MAFCLTVDAPLVGRRDRDTRNRFGLPPGMTWKNLERVGLDRMDAATKGRRWYNTSPTSGTPLSTWEAIEWLRGLVAICRW